MREHARVDVAVIIHLSAVSTCSRINVATRVCRPDDGASGAATFDLEIEISFANLRYLQSQIAETPFRLPSGRGNRRMGECPKAIRPIQCGAQLSPTVALYVFQMYPFSCRALWRCLKLRSLPAWTGDSQKADKRPKAEGREHSRTDSPQFSPALTLSQSTIMIKKAQGRQPLRISHPA